MENIVQVYKELSDRELLKLAINEAVQLRDDVFPIMLNELRSRSIDQNIIDNAIKQRHIFENEAELNRLTIKYSKSTCPICKENTGISYIVLKEIKGFIIISTTKNVQVIGCKSCIENKMMETNKSNLIFGWWSLPFGIIRTPIILIRNHLRINKINVDNISEDFQAFVKNNIGYVLNALNMQN